MRVQPRSVSHRHLLTFESLPSVILKSRWWEITTLSSVGEGVKVRDGKSTHREGFPVDGLILRTLGEHIPTLSLKLVHLTVKCLVVGVPGRKALSWTHRGVAL